MSLKVENFILKRLASRISLAALLSPSSPRANRVNARTEAVEHTHQAIDGEAAEIRGANSSEVRSGDPAPASGGNRTQAFTVQGLG